MSTSAEQIICSNCNSAMPSDLRFCRNCGFRLTTETGGYTGYPASPVASGGAPATLKKKRRLSGMSWIFIGLLIFFVGSAVFTALVSPLRNVNTVLTKKPVTKSYIGVEDFDTTDEGVIFQSISVPGGPADQAGLVGGDVILSFDGQKITAEDQIEDLMVKTPVGKTVDVEYERDGEKKSTKLTTISQEEYRRLSREFEQRPEGPAVFGYRDRAVERVQVPGTKIYGVKIERLYRSQPADLAGIKEGDIITEFDGVPIRTGPELLMRVHRATPYSTVKVVVMRGDEDGPLEKLEIPVKLGKR